MIEFGVDSQSVPALAYVSKLCLS